MPYIKEIKRKGVMMDGATSAGELNFYITTTIRQYLESKGVNYANMNEIVGVLECVKQEFYARKMRPYEDIQIKDNGDVY